MNINKIITLKQVLAEDETENRHFFKSFNLENPHKPLKYNLVGLVLQGREKRIQEAMSGQEYCRECSQEAGQPVYHHRKESFNNFRNKPVIKKHAEELDRINNILFPTY